MSKPEGVSRVSSLRTSSSLAIAVNRLVNLRSYSGTFFRTEMVRIVFQVRDVYGFSFSCLFFIFSHFYDDASFSDKEKEKLGT